MSIEASNKDKNACAVLQNIKIADTTANPAPLGLMGFGMTTVLLNLHNAGLFKLGSMILCMGIFYGGIAQIIAGIMEWKKTIRSAQSLLRLTAVSGFLWLGLLCFRKQGWRNRPKTRQWLHIL